MIAEGEGQRVPQLPLQVVNRLTEERQMQELTWIKQVTIGMVAIMQESVVRASGTRDLPVRYASPTGRGPTPPQCSLGSVQTLTIEVCGGLKRPVRHREP